jgi:LEA14-like dessication related protein
MSFYFLLSLDNPQSGPAEISLGGWDLYLNGRESSDRADLEAEGLPLMLSPSAAAALPLRLDLDLSRGEEPLGAGDEELRAELRLDLRSAGAGESSRPLEVSAEGVFPRIREPVFTITGIAIMKADLINTRFKVSLRIDNPNLFPLELEVLSYELYGAGRFWAGGTERKPLPIPPRSSAETDLALVMNFIDMKRELLDQVISRREVPYRFTGSAEIGTGLDQLPRFLTVFNQDGLSQVTD